ncbi:MAG: hypothetical protein OXU26_00690 [Acidobacteriota bacterium]|nr:hypothetical protein [Acidobacteriota bacterium]MDE2962405.1 hypothetical protein [Acidobacteriota bacterium]
MEFEATSGGFIVKVEGEAGPTIEWIANADEIFILLPPRDKHGRLDPNGKSYIVRVKRHATMSPSTTVYPVESG